MHQMRLDSELLYSYGKYSSLIHKKLIPQKDANRSRWITQGSSCLPTFLFFYYWRRYHCYDCHTHSFVQVFKLLRILRVFRVGHQFSSPAIRQGIALILAVMCILYISASLINMSEVKLFFVPYASSLHSCEFVYILIRVTTLYPPSGHTLWESSLLFYCDHGYSRLW